MLFETSPMRPLPLFLWIAGAYLFLRYLFVPLLPFLLALGVCALLEPAVQRFMRKTGVNRSYAAVAVTTILLLVIGGSIAFLATRLTSELITWSDQLPELIESIPALWSRIMDRIDTWYTACPPFLRSALDRLAQDLNENTPTLVGNVSTFVMEKISSFASALPDIAFFTLTTILALYFSSLNYNMILAFIKRQLPHAWQVRCRSVTKCFRETILKWLRTELLLLLVAFIVLFAGFSWMRLDFALLAAFALSLIDALPVLGAGTVLVPWSLTCFLLGDIRRALCLFIIYGVELLLHSLLEPRLLAGQGNLPSIAVLVAMYLGYHFLGVGGMIFFPVTLILFKQLQDAGIIRIWK